MRPESGKVKLGKKTMVGGRHDRRNHSEGKNKDKQKDPSRIETTTDINESGMGDKQKLQKNPRSEGERSDGCPGLTEPDTKRRSKPQATKKWIGHEGRGNGGATSKENLTQDGQWQDPSRAKTRQQARQKAKRYSATHNRPDSKARRKRVTTRSPEPEKRRHEMGPDRSTTPHPLTDDVRCKEICDAGKTRKKRDAARRTRGDRRDTTLSTARCPRGHTRAPYVMNIV